MARVDIAFMQARCRAMGLPTPEAEYVFHPVRQWRFDWAWPELKVALEQEGVTYTKGDYRVGGRHASRRGFEADIEKYAEAFTLGWRVLRMLPKHIESGQALIYLEPVLLGRVR